MSTISSSTTTTTGFKVTSDTTGTLVLQTGATPTTAVTIDGSQRVGVGATPSAWTTANAMNVVDISATGVVGSDGGATFLNRNGYYNGTNWIYKTNGYAGHYALTSSGQFAWFTAPSGTAGGTVTLTQGMSLDANIYLRIGASNQSDVLTGKPSGIVDATGYVCRAGTGGAISNVFNINWTGSPYLWIDTTNIGQIATVSDYRLKENVVAQSDAALPRVMQLNPVKYNRKEEGIFAGSDAVEEGFLAHELQAVIPSAVHGEKDAVTEDGGIQPQSLNWAPVVSVLVKAIQELNAKITALENK